MHLNLNVVLSVHDHTQFLMLAVTKRSTKLKLACHWSVMCILYM